MKNTDKDYKIIKRNKLKKFAIGSGIFVTGLFLNLTDVECRELIQSNEEAIEVLLSSYTKDDYPSYQEVYESVISLIDIEQFDSKFIDAYNDVNNLVIDDSVYCLDTVLVRHVIGNGAKIIYNGDTSFDIVTNKTINATCDDTIFFKDASFFYEMYLDGKVDGNSIKVTQEEAIKYLDNWQGKSHTESPETIADNKTESFFIERFKNQGR